MFILCQPEESDSYHEELIKIEEDLFSSLGLHYKYVLLPISIECVKIIFVSILFNIWLMGRTIDMASGDLGAPAYRKFDVEAWMPGLGRYGEVMNSCLPRCFSSKKLFPVLLMNFVCICFRFNRCVCN